MIHRKKSTSYGHGRIRKTAHGTFAADLSHGGNRLRRCFRSRAEAEAWIDAQTALDAPPLTAAQMREAVEAFARLPKGSSLLAVVEQGLRVSAPASADVAQLVFDYLGEASTRLRPATLSHYRRQLTLATARLGNDLSVYTKSALLSYLDTLPSPRAKTKALRALSAFFSWLLARDIVTVNPAATIRAPKIVQPPPAVLTLQQTAHLLNAAQTFERGACLPYIAICLFAGLRPEEAMRLRPSDIGTEYITLTASQTKTTSARTIRIRPNLRAILDACTLSTASILPCSPDRFRKHLTALIRLSGIRWSQDILRHSYASYAYELSRDAAATAYEMGHRGTDVFFRHYRGLVQPGDGALYFALTPKLSNI